MIGPPTFETGKHNDISTRFVSELRRRETVHPGVRTAVVSWTKGHATDLHVQAGISSVEDVARNKAANTRNRGVEST